MWNAFNQRARVIAFTSDPSKRYVFEGLPAEVWEAFQAADSKGKYYNANIKSRYRLGCSSLVVQAIS